MIRVLGFRREKLLRGEAKKPLTEEVFTVKEAVILLKVQLQTIYNNITSGKIIPVILDGTIRIKMSDIITI